MGLGFIELIVVIVAGVIPTGTGLFVWTLWKRRAGATDATEGAPLRVAPFVLSLVATGLGGVIGLATGDLFTRRVILSAADAVSTTEGQHDVAVASVYGILLMATWLALPGACATLWLLLSKERSTRTAVVLALLTFIGFTAGVALCLPVIDTLLLPRSPASSLGPIHITIVDLVSGAVRAMFGMGFAGAATGGVAVIASVSKPTMGRTLQLAAPLPFVATSIGALATPPDVVSQILMAGVIVVAWLAGLGAGTLAGRLRARQSGQPPG